MTPYLENAYILGKAAAAMFLMALAVSISLKGYSRSTVKGSYGKSKD